MIDPLLSELPFTVPVTDVLVNVTVSPDEEVMVKESELGGINWSAA